MSDSGNGAGRDTVLQACLWMSETAFDRAFVALWLYCRDLPDIVDRLRAARRDIARHRNAEKAFVESLRGDLQGSRDSLTRLARENPLAALCALESLLRERSGRYFTPRRIDHEGQEYWLVMRSHLGTRNPSHGRAHESLAFFARHFSVIPCRFSAEAIPQPPRIEYVAQDCLGSHGMQRIAETALRGNLRVIVAMFDDRVGFVPPPEGRWLADDLADCEVRWAGIQRTLEACALDADLVVFPELTVTPELRDRIAEWLLARDRGLCWVVAGSFHVRDGGRRLNRSWLLDAAGNQILVWDKFLPVRFGDDDSELVEDIERPEAMRFLDTPLGLIGNPICRDFCEEIDGVRIPWGRIPVDFLFVPSMGGASTVSAHRRAADELWRDGTVCVVANQDIHSGGTHPGFVVGNVEGGDASHVNCVAVVRLDIDTRTSKLK